MNKYFVSYKIIYGKSTGIGNVIFRADSVDDDVIRALETELEKKNNAEQVILINIIKLPL